MTAAEAAQQDCLQLQLQPLPLHVVDVHACVPNMLTLSATAWLGRW